MIISKWKKISKEKEENENQIKMINNQICMTKLEDEIGQIKFNKMFKPKTSRLDAQIDLQNRPNETTIIVPKEDKIKEPPDEFKDDFDPYDDGYGPGPS